MTQKETELRAEVDRLKADIETQKEIAKEWFDQHTEDLKEIAALRKRCQELEAEQTQPSETIANRSESEVIEKLFFACELLHDAGYSEGSDYYAALINTLGLMERFKKWRGERK